MTDVNLKNAAEVAELTKKLLAPFAPEDVKLKPQSVKGNRALAISYVDSRVIMDRLDEAVGINGWRDEYIVLPSGEVECRLSVRIAGEWITKADVGSQSEQSDGGDRMKAAYSDALKRAAVKWGIGRYIYRLPQQWMDFDPVTKKILRPGEQPKQPRQQQPQQQKPQPAPLSERISRLSAGYAACKTAADFEALEGQRSDLWSQIPSDTQTDLKTAAGKARQRLGLSTAAK